MRITAGDQDFLTDDQVEEVASQMVAVLGPAVATMMVAAGIDARDQVRFHAVAERCRARRESQGLSIPSAAGTMKVAQYRLKDILGNQDIEAGVGIAVGWANALSNGDGLVSPR